MLDEPAIVTADWNVFKTKLGEYTGNPRFGAAIAISDNPARIQEFETLSAAAGAPMRFSALIYDKTKLDEWAQTVYRPKFLDGVMMKEFAKVEEAVFDLTVAIPVGGGAIQHIQMRVRRSDGAYALLATKKTKDDAGLEPNANAATVSCYQTCGAGFWHPLCCTVTYGFCRFFNQLLGPILGPSICGNCSECRTNCCCCLADNPCHACDPCGLGLVLCRIVPGGHCG